MRPEDIREGQVWRSNTRDDLLLKVIEVVDNIAEAHATYDESIKLQVVSCLNEDLLNHKTWFTTSGLLQYYTLYEDPLADPTWEV